MSNYDKTNTFTLGKGDKGKPENEGKDQSKWPDYKGVLNVNGEEFYLSAWIKENGTTGEKFFSGAIKAKVAQESPVPKPAGDDFVDSDLPF